VLQFSEAKIFAWLAETWLEACWGETGENRKRVLSHTFTSPATQLQCSGDRQHKIANSGLRMFKFN